MAAEALRFKSLDQVVKQDFELRLPVTAPGAVLHYRFATAGFDICFGVYAEEADGEEDLLPEERVDSHEEPVIGELGPLPFSKGVVVLRWDK